jgi:hypothetical protein
MGPHRARRRERIETPTRGFSGVSRGFQGFINQPLAAPACGLTHPRLRRRATRSGQTRPQRRRRAVPRKCDEPPLCLSRRSLRRRQSWTKSKWIYLDRLNFRRAKRSQLANTFNLTASLAFALKSPNRTSTRVHENAESGKASAADGVKIDVD